MSADITPFAVLASGRGSNFDALMNAQESGRLLARCVLLMSDQRDAPVLDKARRWKVPAHCLPVGSEKDRKLRQQQHEKAMLEVLQAAGVRFLVLAGYMRLIGPTLLSAFEGRTRKGHPYYRIINIHPSLLPQYPGLDAYRQAFDAGDEQSGVTVHLIDQEMDHGPICAQESFSIRDLKSSHAVQEKGQSIEHELYAKTLNWVLQENFEIIEKDGRQHVRQN